MSNVTWARYENENLVCPDSSHRTAIISLFQGHAGGEAVEVLDVGLVEVGVVDGISMHHLPVAGLPLSAELVQDEVPGRRSHGG